MDLIKKIKERMLVVLLIVGAGGLALIVSMVQGHFGLAIEAFIGIAACSTATVFLLPELFKNEDKSDSEN